jgi:hypothetical protein
VFLCVFCTGLQTVNEALARVNEASAKVNEALAKVNGALTWVEIISTVVDGALAAVKIGRFIEKVIILNPKTLLCRKFVCL